MFIHIFNPDTDYAMASNSENYTPPASVDAIRRSLALMPVLYADPGDAVLMPPGTPDRIMSKHPFVELINKKEIKVILPQHIARFTMDFPKCEFRPWGWNKSLRRWLKALGVRSAFLPKMDGLYNLRNLSHRKLTIPFLLNLKDVTENRIAIPRQFTSVNDAISFWNENGDVYFKAPWSSSGRGVMFTRDLELRHVQPWLKGIIRTQGSVMGELAYGRNVDFATEWECHQGKALFAGMSTFITSERGKYKSNIVMPQEEIVAYIVNNTEVKRPGNNIAQIIERQKLLLENYIAQYYQGPLGIDMMVMEDGNIHPCVEINIRNTMGRVAVDIENRIEADDASKLERDFLKKITTGGIFSPMSLLSTLGDMENN